jgi:hypothetical protein
MHIKSETPEKLVVVDGTLWMSIPFAFGFVYMLYKYLVSETTQPAGHHTGNHWNILAPIIMGLFMWASAQHTRFVFNARRRTVEWHRMKNFFFSSGTIPFDDVTDISIGTTTTDKGGKVHWLSVVTKQGECSMSNGYSGFGNFEKMRQRILEFVMGKAAAQAAAAERPDELTSSLRALVAQGRKIEAIELLRTSEGGGLAEAKARIDALQAEMKARQ